MVASGLGISVFPAVRGDVAHTAGCVRRFRSIGRRRRGRSGSRGAAASRGPRRSTRWRRRSQRQGTDERRRKHGQRWRSAPASAILVASAVARSAAMDQQTEDDAATLSEPVCELSDGACATAVQRRARHLVCGAIRRRRRDPEGPALRQEGAARNRTPAADSAAAGTVRPRRDPQHRSAGPHAHPRAADQGVQRAADRGDAAEDRSAGERDTRSRARDNDPTRARHSSRSCASFRFRFPRRSSATCSAFRWPIATASRSCRTRSSRSAPAWWRREWTKRRSARRRARQPRRSIRI